MVRRSQLGGAFDWVEIEGEDLPEPFRALLRVPREITGRISGHKAAIRLSPKGSSTGPRSSSTGNGWITYLPFMPLDPHPPAPDSLAQRASNETEPESCPFCGQTTKRRRAESSTPGPARRRKSWTIKVPDDAEDGAEILDTLVDDLAPHLHIDPTATGRYYVVLPSLVYVHQNIGTFLDSLRGVGA